MNELEIKKIKYELPKINYDLTDIKNEIDIIAKKYDIVIQEENIPSIKKDIANINKMRTSLNRARIDTVKEISKPLETFENDIKELALSLEQTTVKLKEQVNVFTEKQKQEKCNEILAFEEYEGYIIFDDKWLNSSVSMKSIKEDIERQTKNRDNNRLMIKTTCLAVGLEVDKYYEMLNMQRDIQSIIEQINNDKAVKEQYENKEVKATVSVSKEEMTDQDKYTFTLKITGTRVQLKILKEYLVENELDYEKVEG